MEGFSDSADPSRPSEMHIAESWEGDQVHMDSNESPWQLIKPLLHIFSGNLKSTLSHLTTIHNETCGCQTDSSTHQTINKVWNQKKVLFMY